MRGGVVLHRWLGVRGCGADTVFPISTWHYFSARENFSSDIYLYICVYIYVYIYIRKVRNLKFIIIIFYT